MAFFKKHFVEQKNIAKLVLFIASLCIFVVITYGISLLANSNKNFTENIINISYTAYCVSLTVLLWNYQKRILVFFIAFSFLFTFTEYIKTLVNLPLAGNELVNAFLTGNLLFCIVVIFLRFICVIKEGLKRKTAYLFFDIFVVIVLLIPIIFIGYYFLSGQILTASIVLTLFQTNVSEIIGYLKDKNLFLWGLVFLIAVLVITNIVILLNHIKIGNTGFNILESFRGISKHCIVLIMFFAFLLGLKNISYCYLTSVLEQTHIVLAEYKAYEEAKILRQRNLEELKGLSISSGKGGLYVLVIGESETRDHMHAYGYKEETTPWLSAIANRKGRFETILFPNAYANHTHTVEVLTYALSVKNQYNSIDLKNAYSIMEVAKAAGYKTFWISNQVKYGVWDTPVAAISSTADKSIWLNKNEGFSLSTEYYDDKIIEELNKLNINNINDKIFIVCHLMGSHTFYQDRYPLKFKKFKYQKELPYPYGNVQSYDNSVYYTDFVLKEIFDVVSKKEGFKGMIYLSDHGEDPDSGKGHEASMFTWRMAHIPLFMIFSDSFITESYGTFHALIMNRNKYWTNDLLYNVLISILGIENAPGNENKWNIGSSSYEMKKSNLKTLHGIKLLNNEED